MQRHTMTDIVKHSRSIVLERSVKILLESSLLVLPWYIQDICSVRVCVQHNIGLERTEFGKRYKTKQ